MTCVLYADALCCCQLNFLIFCQIKQINEPIEVRITEWNTGGLLTRIEVCTLQVSNFQYGAYLRMSLIKCSKLVLQGLRAFLPKAELLKRVNSFTELKENVSC